MNDTANEGSITGKIVAFRADRLGARLISLVNALRLARKFDVRCQMHWMQTSGVGSEFNNLNDLFSKDFADSIQMPKKEFQALRGDAIKGARLGNYTSQQVLEFLSEGKNISVEMAFGLLCLADEEPTEVAKDCREIFLNLPFAEEIAPLCKKLSSLLNDAVAYHMRRGDLISNIKAKNKNWQHKVVPEAYYHAHMASELAQECDIILFSDEADTIADTKKVFPTLKTIGDFVNTAGLSQGALDMLELYAMASCSKVIAPEASAFSNTAADLGGVRKIDVKADMPDTLRDNCSENLYLQLRDNPEKIGNDGLVGQTLTHVRSYLLENNRFDDAISLYDRFITRGFPISFIYPQQMELFGEIGRPDKILELAERIENLPVYSKRDRQRCLMHTIIAQAKLGQTKACRQSLQRLAFVAPTDNTLCRIVPSLIGAGALDQDNFLPFSNDVVHAFGRQLTKPNPRKPEAIIFTALCDDEVSDKELRNMVGSIKPIWWDWAPFLDGNTTANIQTDAVTLGELEQLKAYSESSGSADARSTLALVAALQGNPQDAILELNSLQETTTNNPLLLHRLSRVCAILTNWNAAADHALAALQSSTAPAHLAWAGVVLMRNRKKLDQARDLLTSAIQAQFQNAIVALNLADLEMRAKQTDAAFSALDLAQKWNPSSVRVKIQQSKLHLSTGNTETARDILEKLWVDENLPMGSYAFFARLLLNIDEKKMALALIDDGLLRKPNKADLLSLRKIAM